MSESTLRRIYLQLAGAVTLVVLLALAASAVLTHRIFEQALVPHMAAKVASVGASIRSLVVRGVESNIALEDLFGVEARFDAMRKELPEASSVALTDRTGRVLFQRMASNPMLVEHMRSPKVLALMQRPDEVAPAMRVGPQYVVSMPIRAAGEVQGTLHIGVDVRFVDDLVLDVLYDVLIVLVVSLFFALELLHFMAGASLNTALRSLGTTFERGAKGDFRFQRRADGTGPFGSLLQTMDGMLVRLNAQFKVLVRDVADGRLVPAHERPSGLQRAEQGVRLLAQRYRFGSRPAEVGDEARLAKVRAPLFVFILSEELTRSFLPAFVRDLSVPVPWLSPQLVLGLPIAVFMLVVALAQPFVGVLCDRAGHRRTMLIGASVAVLGLLGSAMAGSVPALMLWRALCGVGYAMVFVAGQAFVLDNATPASRARGFALFVGAIMAASVCGPSIGGILADNLGARPTLLVAAALAAGSLLVIRLLPPDRAATGRAVARLPRLREIGALVMNKNFMLVTGLAALPAKILLTGLCFYLVPLYILSMGSTQAMAGRVLMTYAVMMVVLSPLMAAQATTLRRMHWLVAGGLLLSGLGGVLMLVPGGIGVTFLTVALVGLGQSMSISAQSALVSEHCKAEIRDLGDGTVYGVYRLLERMGNALGPMLAGALVHFLDYRKSFAVLGLGVLLCGAAFFFATNRRKAQPLALATA